MKGGAMVRRNLVAPVLVAVCLVAWLPRSRSAVAQDKAAPAKPTAGVVEASTAATPRIAALRPGFKGHFKVGYWTPFVVELVGGSETVEGRVRLTVPDSDGVLSRVHAPASGQLTLEAGQRKSVRLYAKLGQITGDVTVSLVNESGGVLTTRRFQAGDEGPLSGVMPSSSTLLVSVGAKSERAGSSAVTRGTEMIQLAEVAALPTEWWGLEGVDTLLLNTSDPRIGEELSRAEAQLAALELWVRMGGRMVLSVGRRGEELLASGSPLAPFAPGEFESVVPLRQGTMLETYAESAEPLAAGAALKLDVTKLRNVRGRVDAFAGTGPRDLPLVVRAPHGFGQIVFVAFELDQPPLSDWVAKGQLLEKILGRFASKASDEDSSTLGAVTTLGFVDLSGQLRGALDQFDEVRLVPFWFVSILVTLYVLFIGPLDYYLVKHVIKRPRLTWITFALTVVAFSAGAVLMAFGLKGRELRVNQLDVVDFDAESGFVRGTSWSNLFSPEIETYDLSLAPSAGQTSAGDARGGVLFSWFGLTGTGFGGVDAVGSATGGMGAASGSLPLFSVAYDYSAQLDRIERVPIAQWASKAFVGRWWQLGSGGVEAKLADDGRLVGTVTNHLDVPLTHAVLVYDRWAYVIHDFAPGRQIDLEFDIDPQTVDTYLRHVTAVGDRKVAAAYNQASFDVARIVEVMTGQELVAGGKAYTGLANQYQGFVELSDLVRLGRAVLIGRVAKAGSTLERDGKPLAGADVETNAWTFHRYVFPVAEQGTP